jgi:hypothetical protein
MHCILSVVLILIIKISINKGKGIMITKFVEFYMCVVHN